MSRMTEPRLRHYSTSPVVALSTIFDYRCSRSCSGRIDTGCPHMKECDQRDRERCSLFLAPEGETHIMWLTNVRESNTRFWAACVRVCVCVMSCARCRRRREGSSGQACRSAGEVGCTGGWALVLAAAIRELVIQQGC